MPNFFICSNRDEGSIFFDSEENDPSFMPGASTDKRFGFQIPEFDRRIVRNGANRLVVKHKDVVDTRKKMK